MMTGEEAQNTLERMLPENCSFLNFWNIYKTFSKLDFPNENLDIESDIFLIEIHEESSGNREFYFGLVRQFSFVNKEGEYSGMEQMICDLKFSKNVRNLISERICLWSEEHEGGFEEICQKIESTEFFEAAKKDTEFNFTLWATGV